MSSAKMQTREVIAQSIPLQGGLSASFAIGLGLVLGIEGVVIHLWVATRSQPWAWVIAAFNVATMYWLWREYRSGLTARMTVDAAEILIDAGSRLKCRFPRALIAGTETATWRSVPDDAAPGWVNTAKPLEPNIIVRLGEPVTARLALGITKRVSRIGLRVDAPTQVVDLLPLHGKTDADHEPV